MSHILLISLGPVQDFIQAARRTRDLWFGSHLLSELSKAAARALAREAPLEHLIFPAPETLDQLERGSQLNVANKILARVTDPAEAAARARREVEHELELLFREAAAEFEGRAGYDGESARRQIRDLLEFFWASIPDTGRWAEDRARLEQLMAGRKNLRSFAPVSWGSSRPKASLDGQREAVLDLAVMHPDPRARARYLRRRRIRPGETFCAVTLLKRFGARDHEQARFLSTAHVAALSALADPPDTAPAAFREYLRDLEALGAGVDDLSRIPGSFRHPVTGTHDAQILFPSRLQELFDEPEAARQAEAALRRFSRSLGLSPSGPSPYYAILMADGDRVGRALDRQQSAEGHRALSQALARFSAQASDLIRAHEGAPIYTGGDDVLALLPLHRALPCAQALSQAFRAQTKSFGVNEEAPTLSAGLAVVHHGESLGEALDLARRMEKKAKSLRDALAVGVDKRSGSETSAVGRWGDLDLRILRWARLLEADRLPRGAAYELRQLALSLGGAGSPSGLLQAEARRVLERKRSERGARPLDQELLEELLAPSTDPPGDGSFLLDRAREIILAGSFLTTPPRPRRSNQEVCP